MFEYISQFMASGAYLPHGYCIGWWTPLVSTFVVSDTLIFLSYFSMPVALAYFARQRTDFPYLWLLWMSAAFILACGSTHLMDVVVLWWPYYGLNALLKAATAVISVVTAVALWPLIPHALKLPSPSHLRKLNEELEREILIRKDAEESLKKAKEAAEEGLIKERLLMAAIVESSEDAIIAETLDGIVTSWNGAAEKLLGYSASEIVGRSLLDLVVAGEREDEEKILQAIANGQSIRHLDTVRIRKDGHAVDVSVSISPVLDKRGRIIGASKIVRDISDKKRAEAKITELNSSLERQVVERTAELAGANQELEAFAYAVSHDLRAPLRAMSGFARILEEDYAEKLEPDARECIEHISKASHNMGQLIEGLLVLSRVTRGELVREPVKLQTMIEEIRAELERNTPDRSVEWQIEDNLTVRGDPRLLVSVMRNLLENAWKYTAHTEKPVIRIFGENQGGRNFICVADNGAGFDMAYAQQLFQPFRRLHRQEEFTGLGIGLATVLRIIHRHGGTIEAEAKPGEGAKFRFNLPEIGDVK